MSNKFGNEGFASLVTTILKGLENPNKTEPSIKGGAPDDDGLAKLIVSILKALSNKDNANASTKSSMFSSPPTITGDPTDLLIKNILTIIISLAEGSPLSEPEPESNLKGKAISVIGSMMSGLGKFVPSSRDPTIYEGTVHVKDNDTICDEPNEREKIYPIAIGEKNTKDDCINSNINDTLYNKS
jgi:hypothetical protein